ncbi:hypothetical protein TNIN_396281 [Trichonephila inaurata madagascariensis]|uniref:Uncharacterized protein n=1 Tax=Trichonephila inaurata madagascariensis TaxID=2747483 RepID=A0A8X6JKL3_9ARAC|nr:hypothetical protein TNIN_396281 [Trichonephila inaurata madagascariensis]
MEGYKTVCYGSCGRICEVAYYQQFRCRSYNHESSEMCEYFAVSTLRKQNFKNYETVVRGFGQKTLQMCNICFSRSIYMAITGRSNRKPTDRQLNSELATTAGNSFFCQRAKSVFQFSQQKNYHFYGCEEHHNWSEYQWTHILVVCEELRFGFAKSSLQQCVTVSVV